MIQKFFAKGNLHVQQVQRHLLQKVLKANQGLCVRYVVFISTRTQCNIK